ncbi:MAG: site-2 protease family protein [Patescibacteria group bacterium]
MSILLFLLVLFVLVLVHEWGHFIVAKKTGMRVDEFAIGFPPKMFGLKKGETEYNFNLLPIGGYVKIYGENREEGEEATADSGRAFHARPKWAQAIVLLAGITMNILFAWFLFSATLLIGVPQAVNESTASEEATLIVAGTLKDAPADGVLPVGAEIIGATVGDKTLVNPGPASFSEFVAGADKNLVMITYRHDGVEKTVALLPQAGLIEGDPEKAIIGTSLALIEIKRLGVVGAVIEGLKMTGQGTVSIMTGLYTLIKESIVGTADFASVAGPVGIIGMVGDAASYGLTPLLTFTAIISLNLAVINLLPFPALDGGRLLFVVIETVTRKEVPPTWTGWANLVGFVLLMVLMAAVTFNDISRLL